MTTLDEIKALAEIGGDIPKAVLLALVDEVTASRAVIRMETHNNMITVVGGRDEWKSLQDSRQALNAALTEQKVSP